MLHKRELNQNGNFGHTLNADVSFILLMDYINDSKNLASAVFIPRYYIFHYNGYMINKSQVISTFSPYKCLYYQRFKS